MELVAVVTALVRTCGSTAWISLMHGSAAMTVAAAPPPILPDLLPALATGRSLGTLAFSEAGSRSHFWAPVSKAKHSGSDVRVDVAKSLVTSAGHADVYVTSTGNVDADTVDLFAIPAKQPGVTVAGTWTGLGLRGNAYNQTYLSEQVSERARIGSD